VATQAGLVAHAPAPGVGHRTEPAAR
jgi:hypothetical protein